MHTQSILETFYPSWVEKQYQQIAWKENMLLFCVQNTLNLNASQKREKILCWDNPEAGTTYGEMRQDESLG